MDDQRQTHETLRSIQRKLDDILLDLRGDPSRGHLGIKGRMEKMETKTSGLDTSEFRERLDRVEHKAKELDGKAAYWTGAMAAIGTVIGFCSAIFAGWLKSFFD